MSGHDWDYASPLRISQTAMVVNPLRFLIGGWPYSLDLHMSVSEARGVLGSRVVDPTTDRIEMFLNARKASHLLAGKVHEDQMVLYAPGYARWPMWPLSPVFRGTLVPDVSGESTLTGRMLIRRWRAVVWMLIAISLAVLSPAPGNYFGYVLIAAGVLQLTFVLQETTQELSNRISDALRAATRDTPAAKSAS